MVHKMGVVRREGNWRLEKHDDGVYEVTYNDQSELRVITSDYEPTGFNDKRNDFTIPVREVQSFTEAEELFEQKATDHSQTGFGGRRPTILQGGLEGLIRVLNQLRTVTCQTSR